MKILVVEDEADIRKNLGTLLSFEGHEVLEAPDGQEGLALARAHKPDLIFSDVMMPRMDGHALLAALKSDPRTHAIPLVFLTAKAERADVRKGMTQGASDYLTKPFDRQDVLQAVESVMVRQRLLEESALHRAATMLEDASRISRHDIKTPLNFLAHAPGLLRAMRPVSDAEEAVLRGMEEAARRALETIEMTLAITQMESGRYRSQPVQVNLAKLLDEVVAELAAHADSKAVAISVPPAPGGVWVLGEERLCYSILANLLKNAIEASPDGAAVTVQVGPGDDGMVSLSIRNQGAVPLALRAHFFTKYSTAGKAHGMGLGTYSAQLFAQAQNGMLWLDATCEGQTTLNLALPQAPIAQEGAPLPLRLDLPTARESLSILLVDDDPFNHVVMEGHLRAAGVGNVATAINGREALARLAEQRPDFVFLDIEMPVMDGYATLAAIRDAQTASSVRPSFVVAFSGNDDAQHIAHYLRCGFDAAIPKTGNRDAVRQLLDRLVHDSDRA